MQFVSKASILLVPPQRSLWLPVQLSAKHSASGRESACALGLRASASLPQWQWLPACVQC